MAASMKPEELNAIDFVNYLNTSQSAFHCVAEVKRRLTEAGFVEVSCFCVIFWVGARLFHKLKIWHDDLNPLSIYLSLSPLPFYFAAG